tara:strand:+ start:39601 stop:39720 length:120 start_codon:yes stop_codon:yes gene_type:complete
MSEEDYKKIMFYLTKIEECLNEIAIKVGHPTMEEFFNKK